MQPAADVWPAKPWRLTAPESYVLQNPENPRGATAFKLALKELVLRKALAVEPVKARTWLLYRTTPKSALRDGPNLRAVTQPTLAPVLALYGTAEQSPLRTTPVTDAPGWEFDGVLVKDLAKMARSHYASSLAGYIDYQVTPALVDRGFLRSEEYKRFGLFDRSHHVITSAGRAAADEFDEWLRVGHRLSDWEREDPARALAYAGSAGAAVLLMTGLYPELDRLSEHARQQATSGTGVDLSALEFDRGAFPGLDSAFAAIDADVGTDAGGGGGWLGNGGGGNGGGGNGGGGGG